MKKTNKTNKCNFCNNTGYIQKGLISIIIYSRYSMVGYFAKAYKVVVKQLHKQLTTTQEHFIFIALLFVFVWAIVGGLI